jgi:hypothetical protein
MTFAASRCPVCKMALKEGDLTTGCAQCDTVHHTVCWQANGGCSTYACEGAPVLQRAPLPTNLRAGWGDEKHCPACSGTLPASALVCSCGAKFPWADPMTSQSYTEWRAYESARRTKRSTLIILFLLSLTGLAAPIAGIAAAVTAFLWRRDLAGDYGAFLALGYGAGAVGIVYSLIFVGLRLGF